MTFKELGAKLDKIVPTIEKKLKKIGKEISNSFSFIEKKINLKILEYKKKKISVEFTDELYEEGDLKKLKDTNKSVDDLLEIYKTIEDIKKQDKKKDKEEKNKTYVD